MEGLALFVHPNLKDYGIQLGAHAADRQILLR
jgi:hypothetical protein